MNTKKESTMNKSLENVIKKAAFKGIEPLRRRYTASTNMGSSSGNSNHTVRYRNGVASQSSVDEPQKRSIQN